MKLNVLVVSSNRVLFEGKAKSIIVPGEQGVFELALFHKEIASRLVTGVVFIDAQPLRVRNGIIKASDNRVTIVCEPM